MIRGISPYKKYPKKAQAKINAGSKELCICGKINPKCFKNFNTSESLN